MLPPESSILFTTTNSGSHWSDLLPRLLGPRHLIHARECPRCTTAGRGWTYKNEPLRVHRLLEEPKKSSTEVRSVYSMKCHCFQSALVCSGSGKEQGAKTQSLLSLWKYACFSAASSRTLPDNFMVVTGALSSLSPEALPPPSTMKRIWQIQS